MAFRDDRDALRARAEAATLALEEAQSRLDAAEERASAHERKDVEDERELGRLRAEVARLGGEARIETKMKLPWSMETLRIAVGAAVIFAGIVSWLAVRAMYEEEDIPTTSERGLPPPPPSSSPHPVGAPTPRSTLAERARFGAVVLSAEGIALRPGDGCVVDAERPRGEVEVRCAEHMLFSGPARQMSRSGVPAPDAAMRDALVMSDPGDTETQLQLATPTHTLRVWTGEWDVRLRVAPLSEPRPITERVTLTAAPDPRMWRAVLDRPDRGAPSHGTDCVLERYPNASEPLPCRFVLACGDSILYGAGESGYADCTDDSANDDSLADGDPALRIDGDRLVLEGEHEGRSWRETYALYDDDRCNLNGRWVGHWRDRDGQADDVTFEGGRLTLTTGQGIQGLFMHATLDCETGAVGLSGTDYAYAGHFGPEFATVLLRSDEALLELIRVHE